MLRRLISLLATYSHCFAPASLARQAATSSGTFNVLSISIHGISSLLVPDDGWSYRDVYTKYIGQKISEYDYEVINVQEARCLFSPLCRRLGINTTRFFRTSTTTRRFTNMTTTRSAPQPLVAL